MPYYRNDRDDTSALSIVTKVVAAAGALTRLQGAGQEQENAQMRGMLLERELQGPSERDKFQFEQAKFGEQQRAEQIKYALTKFSELSKESSPATKAVMMGHMENIYAMMTPVEREVSKMVLAHSPLNPIEQKSVWWDATMRAPQVNADPTKDPYAYGVQILNLVVYTQKRENFIANVPINKTRIKPIAADVFVVRGDNDKVGIMTSMDLGLAQIAEKHGTTPGAILANNGLVYGTEQEVMVGGVLSKVRSVYDALGGKAAGMQITPTAGSVATLDKEQQDLQDLLASWVTKDVTGKTQGSRVYAGVQKMLDNGASMDEAMEYVKNVYPGRNFRIEGVGKQTLRSQIPFIGGLFDAYAEGPKERIVSWPGNPIELKAKNGSKVGYYDARSGKVYGGSGKKIADNLDELRDYIAARTVEELDKEMGGK